MIFHKIYSGVLVGPHGPFDAYKDVFRKTQFSNISLTLEVFVYSQRKYVVANISTRSRHLRVCFLQEHKYIRFLILTLGTISNDICTFTSS